jgi:hypothetical protein
VVVSEMASTEGKHTDNVYGRDFRSSRLWSATLLLSKINSGSLQIRMHNGTLLLVGALVFYINSLHSRPDDESNAREFCKAIFPLTDDPDSPDRIIKDRPRDGEPIPYAIGGVMYLRDIGLKPTYTTYRFCEFLQIDQGVFNYALGCSQENVAHHLFQAGIQRYARMAGYVPQRKGFTKTRAPKEDEELVAQFPAFEGLVEQLVVETEEGLPAPPQEIQVGNILETILQQYGSDIMQKCGNPRSAGSDGPVDSYCPLMQYERQHLSFDDINTLNLGTLFNQVQWRRATPDEWEDGFNRIFPHMSHIDPFQTAHFAKCRYYTTYRNLLTQLTKPVRHDVRTALYEKIAELAWIPATKSDRLWDYSLGDRTWKKGPVADQRGPRLLVNPRTAGQVGFGNNPRADAVALEHIENERRRALREEEEEESTEEDMPAVARNWSGQTQERHNANERDEEMSPAVSNRPDRWLQTGDQHVSRARNNASINHRGLNPRDQHRAARPSPMPVDDHWEREFQREQQSHTNTMDDDVWETDGEPTLAQWRRSQQPQARGPFRSLSNPHNQNAMNSWPRDQGRTTGPSRSTNMLDDEDWDPPTLAELSQHTQPGPLINQHNLNSIGQHRATSPADIVVDSETADDWQPMSTEWFRKEIIWDDLIPTGEADDHDDIYE